MSNTPAKKQAAKSQSSGRHQVAIQQHYSGPIPPPEHLERFDRLLPGAANRILAMAEDDARKRADLEISVMQKEAEAERLRHKEVTRGQIFAMSATVLSFAAVFAALFLGLEKAAIAIGTTTVVGLVAAFIKGR